MHEAHEEILHLTVSGVRLIGRLVRPPDACGVVLLAQDELFGASSARTGHLARLLRQAGFATLACDLSGEFAGSGSPVEEPARLAVRICAWLELVRQRPGLSGLPLGLAAEAHAGAAALLAAMQRPDRVHALAVVSCGADLAQGGLAGVRCPTLLAAGEHDRAALRHSQVALRRLRCHRRLEVLPGVNRHAQEANAVVRIAVSIRRWMRRYLIPPTDASCADVRPSLRVISCDAPDHGTAIARSRVGLEALVAATRGCAARALPPRTEEE